MTWFVSSVVILAVLLLSTTQLASAVVETSLHQHHQAADNLQPLHTLPPNEPAILVETGNTVRVPPMTKISILNGETDAEIKGIDPSDSLKGWTEIVDVLSIKLKITKHGEYVNGNFRIKKNTDEPVQLAHNTASGAHVLVAGTPVKFTITPVVGEYSFELFVVAKFTPYTVGLELETKQNSIKIQLRAEDETVGSLGKDKVAVTVATYNGYPYLQLVPDEISDNFGCIEIVSAPLEVGFSDHDQYTKEFLKLRKAIRFLVQAAVEVTAEKEDEAWTLFDLVLVKYNEKIDEEPTLANYKLPATAVVVTKNLKQYKFYIKGKAKEVEVGNRRPQVNYDFPLAALSVITGVDQNQDDPANIADLFKTTNFAYFKAVQTMARNLVTGLAEEGRAYKLTDETALVKKELTGVLAVLLHELVAYARFECKVFHSTVAVWFLNFLNRQIVRGLPYPSAARYVGHNELRYFTRLEVYNSMTLSVTDSGTGKNLRDQLFKVCVEKLFAKLPLTLRNKLKTWWTTGHALRDIGAQLDLQVGRARAIKRDAVLGAAPIFIDDYAWAPRGECDAYVEAEIEGVELTEENQDAYEVKADRSFLFFMKHTLRELGGNIFNPGAETCMAGTNGVVNPKQRGKNNLEWTFVAEMRESHPMDNFNAWAEADTWVALVKKWRAFFHAQSIAAHA